MLTRDQILAAKDRRTEVVTVAEWGGDVTVTEMTGAQRDAWEQSLVAKSGGVDITNVRARLVARCIVDDKGERLFSDDDAEALGAKSGAALDRVAKVCQRLNGLSDDDVEAARKN